MKLQNIALTVLLSTASLLTAGIIEAQACGINAGEYSLGMCVTPKPKKQYNYSIRLKIKNKTSSAIYIESGAREKKIEGKDWGYYTIDFSKDGDLKNFTYDHHYTGFQDVRIPAITGANMHRNLMLVFYKSSNNGKLKYYWTNY